MRVLITGITGFIGSHLAERLIDDGHKVYAIVRPTSDIQYLLPTVRQQVDFRMLDANHTLFDIMSDLDDSDMKPEIVYHLASLYLSRHQPQEIGELIASNITFGTELLEAMANHDITRLVWAGTSWQHYQDEVYNPVNLYAATKEAYAVLLKYYRETAGVQDICLQLFDTYGSRDKRRKLIHLLLEIAETGENLAMSPGNQQIDLVHIDDVVSAFVTAGELLSEERKGCVYAVSSGRQLTLRELVRLMERILQKPLNITWGGRPYREREVMLPWQKGERLPDWQPKITLEDGLRRLLAS